MQQPDQLLTVAQVAARIGCTRKHVFGMIQDGRLPAPIRAYGPPRFRLTDLERLENQSRRRVARKRLKATG